MLDALLLHNWADKGADGTMQNQIVFADAFIHDTARNFAINVHQYFDPDFSGTHDTCIKDMSKINMPAFVAYLKKNKFKAFVSEFGTGRDPQCMADLKQFLKLLKDNAYTANKGYGFIGWTAWSAGHAWGGYPGYKLYIDSDSPQMGVFKPK